MANANVLRDRLNNIAGNLYWSWNRKTCAPFTGLNPEMWEKTRSPWRVLQHTSDEILDSLSESKGFLHKLSEAESCLADYLDEPSTWHQKAGKPLQDGKVAYFCMEYGLHESFPIYSGGLGILAGDHMKTASDMGLPMVGVGFLYRCGYVTQEVNEHSWQDDHFETLYPADLPVEEVQASDGSPLVVSVPAWGRTIHAKVFRAKVGRISLYLLDTDVDGNSHDDRNLTRNLYGGGVDTRILQELLLGVGGVRALEGAGESISGYHMNEGHAAFLVLELALKAMQSDGLSLADAVQKIAPKCAFTTHTPVDAGHDRFDKNLATGALRDLYSSFGISDEEFLRLGRTEDGGHDDPFNMTLLALHGSCTRNGVSQLHGAISRGMFHSMWPEKSQDDVPIMGITNGTHIHSWLSKPMREALALIAGRDWSTKLLEPQAWENTDRLAASTLWACHNTSKKALIDLVQKREETRWARLGQPERALPPLDPNILTLGFARRFAPYKRATLILRDKDRLLQMLTHPEHPMQLVFAGKCHPANQVGKGLLQELDRLSRDPAFQGRIRFVEGYDMELGRGLVQGVDVWLNTPRRPREASGTSGMKAAMNGVPSLSILDGWWCEGFNGKNGWGFGMTELDVDPAHRDEVDGAALYETLENSVIPLFYSEKTDGVPLQWVDMMKEAVRTGVTGFNTERMLSEYVAKMYTLLS